VKAALPALPEQRMALYMGTLQLTAYDAALLTEEKNMADYFDQLLLTDNSIRPKSAANWISGPVKNWMNEERKDIGSFPLSPAQLASVISLVEKGQCSFTAASGKLFSEYLKDPTVNVAELASRLNLVQVSDSSSIEPVIDAVLGKMSAKVEEYKKGKKGLLALFVGEVMKQTKGKADPKLTNDLIIKKLNSSS
jgi:aspartyl-tRNA(Asn)/glutamyl-tRNA(Gln) amidotransferase subunit B